jgi:hypothetical protein
MECVRAPILTAHIRQYALPRFVPVGSPISQRTITFGLMPTSICNGCGQARNLTKDHLISLPIGKVIVRDRGIDTKGMAPS